MAMNFPPPGAGKSSGKKRMLDKMKMPGEGDPGMGMEEGSPEEEASESPEEEAGEDTAGGQDLTAVSDEDLMAEIKKRGLTGELENGDQEAPAGDSSEAGY